MKKVQKIGILVLLASIFVGCDLEDELNNLTNLEKLSTAAPIVEENIEVQAKVFDVFENVNNVISASNQKSINLSGDKPEIIIESDINFILDYSNVNNASGKIRVEFNGLPLFVTPNLDKPEPNRKIS